MVHLQNQFLNRNYTNQIRTSSDSALYCWILSIYKKKKKYIGKEVAKSPWLLEAGPIRECYLNKSQTTKNHVMVPGKQPPSLFSSC